LYSRYQVRALIVWSYVEVYRKYCWPIRGNHDLKLAPFHILATEGAVHVDKTHQWHMDTISRIVGAALSPCLQTTSYKLVDLMDPDQQASVVAWWRELTEQGGEGLVVKPLDFLARGKRGLVQPAMKCRGRASLQLDYGVECTTPENLERLRQRHPAVKRAIALREFTLGIEVLERVVRGEPLRRVHECVFGVLALEGKPVDPRL
jgi:protein phosphatase